MARRHASSEDEAEINITPMLDMVFILLIFFIVTSSFVRLPGVSVRKPSAETAKQLSSSILIGITADGQIWMNKQHISLDQIPAMVQAARSQAPTGEVVLLTDKDAPTGVVVNVMGQASQGGATSIAIAAVKPSQGD